MGNDNHDEGKKGLDFVRAIGFFFYILNVYWFCQPFFRALLPENFCHISYQILSNAHNRIQLFAVPHITLLVSLLFIGLYGWAERVKKEDKITINPLLKPICGLLESIGIIDRGEDGRVVEDDDNGKSVEKIRPVRMEGWCIVIWGLFLTIISPIALKINANFTATCLYILISALGILYFVLGCNYIHRISRSFGTTNSEEEESFKQNEELIDNPYSINLRTRYKYKGEERNGWINVVNPFRATSVLGTPGSGKTYAVINEFIRQHLHKNFTMYCYDFKFPDLSTLVYNHYKWNEEAFIQKHGVKPQFCVINFDDPRKSLRCNPIDPTFMTDITDAYDSAYTIMLNLNKSWAQKQGDFFVESPINYLTASIWYLKEIEGGKYCTLPHVIEWINAKYSDCIPLMSMNPSLTNYMSAFMEAWEGGAQDQLQGQIASVRIPLSRISSPQLYWIMTGNDFHLDLNNPETPKILCVGNNPEKKDIYATALGLYNGRIVKVINKKGRLPISLIIDELPTIFFRGLDNLIATARSNKVSVCLGYQDFTQLIRDYGEKEAKAIINTIGNIFSGQVTGDTASQLEKRFGKNMQRRKSQSFSSSGVSTSISEQNDTMIPASKISTLTQGAFIGAVADNFGEEIEEKIFNARILIDQEAVRLEEKALEPLPSFYSFDTPEEVNLLKQNTLIFLKKYFVIICGYEKQLRSIINIDNQETDLFFRQFNPFSEEITLLGKKITQKTQNLLNGIEASLQQQTSPTEDRILRKNLLVDFINDPIITHWIIQEREYAENKHEAEALHLSTTLRMVMERIDTDKKVPSPLFAEILSPLVKALEYFTHLSKFSTLTERVREEAMNKTLKRNEEKVRKEIKELIERQLNILNNDEKWEELSRRRKESLGIA